MFFAVIKQVLQLMALAFVGGLIGKEFGHFWIGFSLALLIEAISKSYYFHHVYAWLKEGANGSKPFANNFWSALTGQVAKITTKLRMENDLLKSNVEYFKESFQALNDAVVVIDDNGIIDWANSSAERLLGIYLEQDAGQLFSHLIRAPEVINYLDQADYTSPISIISPTSLECRLEIQVTRFRKNYTLLFARDITDLYKLETMRRDFVANVSHELRTPLTVISGYLETLRDHSDNLPPVWLRAIDQMLNQSARMDEMVDDLIWLSRLEALPSDDKEFECFSLQVLLQSIINDVELSFPTKVVSLSFESSYISDIKLNFDATVKLRSNFLELQSAFTNLIQNAAKYTSDDGKIDIKCSILTNKLHVCFSDNGVGIDSKHLNRLTERFYRVDDSRTSGTGGTGLGLAIVKHILARHQADLHIDSELGKGSQFTCVFPLTLIEK